MMMFLDAQEDFRIVISRSVRLLLPRQRENHSRVLLTQCGQLVTPVAAGNFDARPLAPQIKTGRGLDHLADVGSADARGAFQKIELASGMRPIGRANGGTP